MLKNIFQVGRHLIISHEKKKCFYVEKYFSGRASCNYLKEYPLHYEHSFV